MAVTSKKSDKKPDEKSKKKPAGQLSTKHFLFSNRGIIVILTAPTNAHSPGYLKVISHDTADPLDVKTAYQEYAYFPDSKGHMVGNTVYFTWAQGITPQGVVYYYALIN